MKNIITLRDYIQQAEKSHSLERKQIIDLLDSNNPEILHQLCLAAGRCRRRTWPQDRGSARCCRGPPTRLPRRERSRSCPKRRSAGAVFDSLDFPLFTNSIPPVYHSRGGDSTDFPIRSRRPIEGIEGSYQKMSTEAEAPVLRGRQRQSTTGTSSPKSSGRKRGQTFSVKQLPGAARRLPLSQD